MNSIWSLGISKHRALYAILVIAALIVSVTTALQPVLTGRLLESISGGEWDKAKFLTLCLLAVFVGSLVLTVLSSWLRSYIGGAGSAKLRDYTMERAVHVQRGMDGELAAGEVQNRIIIDTATVPYIIVNAIPEFLRIASLLLLCVIGMAFISLELLGVVSLVAVLSGLSVWLIVRWIRSSTRKTRAYGAMYGTLVWEVLEALNVYKARNAESYALSQLAKQSDKLRKSGIRMDFASGLVIPLLNLGTQIALVLSIGGIIWSISSDNLSAGQGVTFLMFMLYALSPAVELGTLVAGMAQAKVAESRLREIWIQQPEGQGSDCLPHSLSPSVACKDLSFSYPDSPNPVLDDVNLNIKGPGLYLIYGSNGVGKSTLLTLLNGILPGQGNIFVNDTDTSTVSKKSWRDNVLLVDQERKPFEGTLRDNLGTGLQISDSEKMKAMKRSGFVNHYQDLDVELGSGGIELSGGQRSLLALTDALLRKPQVLLLDEITAGVDKETIPIVRNLIMELAKDSTILAVTHDRALEDIPHQVIEMAGTQAKTI